MFYRSWVTNRIFSYPFQLDLNMFSFSACFFSFFKVTGNIFIFWIITYIFLRTKAAPNFLAVTALKRLICNKREEEKMAKPRLVSPGRDICYSDNLPDLLIPGAHLRSHLGAFLQSDSKASWSFRGSMWRAPEGTFAWGGKGIKLLKGQNKSIPGALLIWRWCSAQRATEPTHCHVSSLVC